jgi:hypothetical protein
MMSPLQVPVIATYNTKLNTILDAVMEKIYGTKTTVITEATTAGTLQTCITTGSCAWTYTVQENMTLHEAEADAIYQCLRYLTNVIGYKIIDLNHPTLEKLISQLNNWNRQNSSIGDMCNKRCGLHKRNISQYCNTTSATHRKGRRRKHSPIKHFYGPVHSRYEKALW